MKFALLPAAIAGALLSGNAFAGTDACIEITKSTVAYGEVNAQQLYLGSSCDYSGGSADVALKPNEAASVAYELTKELPYSLEDITMTAYTGKPKDDLSIVYVPTTDIPPASRLTFDLSINATFNVPGDIIYLIKVEEDTPAVPAVPAVPGTPGTPATPATYKYTAVASSDGDVDTKSTALFMFKSGVTVGAGSRLFLSTANQPLNLGEIETPGITLGFAPECSSEEAVTLAVTKAETDNGYPIKGAVTKKASNLVTQKNQFVLAKQHVLAAETGTQYTVEADVDAEMPAYRKYFVTNATETDENGQPVTPANWDGQTTGISVLWQAQFINKAGELDLPHRIQEDDDVILETTAKNYSGEKMFLGLASQTVNGDSALDDSADDHLSATIDRVEFNNSVNWAKLQPSRTIYTIDADEVLDPASGEDLTVTSTRNLAMQLKTDGITPMQFGYSVNANFGLDLDQTAAGISGIKYQNIATYCNPKTPFAIDVNGAVLKVPHGTPDAGNFVRIVNEHESEATVSVEMFDESDNTNNKVTFMLDASTGFGAAQYKLGAYDSSVFEMKKIFDQYKIEAAKQGHTAFANSNRATMTFTVTAPENKVHATSVIKGPGNTDRVMAVLDTNDWAQ